MENNPAPPSIEDYLNAINVIDPKDLNAAPKGYHVLTDKSGDAVRYTDVLSGFRGVVFLNDLTNQILIAHKPSVPVPGSLSGLPVGEDINHGAFTSDMMIANQTDPRRLQEDILALKSLYRKAITDHNELASPDDQISLDASNIFVTGHSLAGYIAQKTAKEGGFRGASFGAPGLVGLGKEEGQQGDFDNYSRSMDPVPHQATDQGNPFRLEKDQYHYGRVIEFGPENGSLDLQYLHDDAMGRSSFPSGEFGSGSGAIGLGLLFATAHPFPRYAQGLGVTLGKPEPPLLFPPSTSSNPWLMFQQKMRFDVPDREGDGQSAPSGYSIQKAIFTEYDKNTPTRFPKSKDTVRAALANYSDIFNNKGMHEGDESSTARSFRTNFNLDRATESEVAAGNEVLRSYSPVSPARGFFGIAGLSHATEGGGPDDAVPAKQAIMRMSSDPAADIQTSGDAKASGGMASITMAIDDLTLDRIVRGYIERACSGGPNGSQRPDPTLRLMPAGSRGY